MDTTTTDSLTAFARIASDHAMHAAADYMAMRAPGSMLDRVGELTEVLRRQLRSALPGALDDAREALACGMGDAAEADFIAAMKVVGLDAAREVLTAR